MIIPSLMIEAVFGLSTLLGTGDWPKASYEPARQLAVLSQLFDPQELTYHWEEDYTIRYIRLRINECREYPMIEDAGRWGYSFIEIAQMKKLNEDFSSFCEARLAADPNDESTRSAKLENEKLWECIDALQAIKNEKMFITYRRERLAGLRDLIGAPAFYRGDSIPAIPWWRLAYGQ